MPGGALPCGPRPPSAPSGPERAAAYITLAGLAAIALGGGLAGWIGTH